MIWNCLIKYSGTKEYVNEFRYSEGSFLKLDTKGIDSSVAWIHTYESTHPQIPPRLHESNGKMYLLPEWKEVHPKTTMNDVRWIKPKVKATKPKEIKVGEYTLKYNEDKGIYSCNCLGWKFVKDKKQGCKHVKEYKSGLQNF